MDVSGRTIPDVNILLSVEAIRPPLTGIGRYNWELASRLPQVGGLTSVRFIANSGWVPDVAARLTRSEAALTLRRSLARSTLARAAYRVMSPLLFRMRVRGLENFIFHGPNFYLPPFPGACVATIHDLSILRHPEFHPPVRVRHMEKEIARTLKKATALIADSEYVRREIIDYLGWPAGNVHVVPLAPRHDSVPRGPAETSATLGRFGLTHGNYALCVSTIEPRKNIDTLLTAYELLPASLRCRFPLVLAGDRGWLSEQLHARIQAARAAGWLRYLGYVSDTDLSHLYCGARLFAYPSLYEGFGLPVLEAMSSGVPVLCSDHPSLDDAAGDAALRVAPGDADRMSHSLACLLESDSDCALFANKGRHHAARFSWQRTAEETAAVYKRIAPGQART